MTILDAAEFDCSVPAPTGPVVALRLTFQVAPQTDLPAFRGELAGLLHALHDLDQALGGQGLILDPGRSGTENGSLTMLLRPLDIRWSLDRCSQMAQLLAGAAPEAEEGAARPLDTGLINDVLSLSQQQNGAETGSARDRVKDWPARQKWIARLGVELVRRKVG